MKTSAAHLLWEVLFTRIWARLVMMTLALLSTVFGLLGPLFQKIFLDRLSQAPGFSWLKIPWLDGISPYSLLFFAFLCLLLSLALFQAVIYVGMREALWMQRNLAQRLFSHTLEMRSDSLHGKSVGEIVSIYTTDVPGATILLEQSLPQGLTIFFPLVLGPCVLIFYFGVPAASLLPLLLSILGLNFILALRQSRFFFKFKKLAALRVGFVNEWVQNLRTLRILGWMQPFEEKIFDIRRTETLNRISMLNNGQTMNAIASSFTFVLNVFLISLMLRIQAEAVTPGTLLALLWIVAIFLTRPFRQMPWFFTFVFDGWTSLKRIAELLALRNTEPMPRSLDFQKLHVESEPGPRLRVKGLSYQIEKNKLLDQIEFEARPGEFLAIVGEVGSGKSLLLLSLMGETGATFGEYWIGANDARQLPLDQVRQFFTFVPQEGFIMSATLRENVAFEYGASRDQDENVIRSLNRAQFDLSQEKVLDGLETEIGERGVNLSGGQRQRVSLGRVDFFEAPIVLLDDCLSAVDVDTEKKLIRDLLAGSWAKRTRILVTHRLTILKEVDRILFLDQGKIKAVGTFEELMATSKEFQDYTASLERTDVSTRPPAPVEDATKTRTSEVIDDSERSPDSV